MLLAGCGGASDNGSARNAVDRASAAIGSADASRLAIRAFEALGSEVRDHRNVQGLGGVRTSIANVLAHSYATVVDTVTYGRSAVESHGVSCRSALSRSGNSRAALVGDPRSLAYTLTEIGGNVRAARRLSGVAFADAFRRPSAPASTRSLMALGFIVESYDALRSGPTAADDISHDASVLNSWINATYSVGRAGSSAERNNLMAFRAVGMGQLHAAACLGKPPVGVIGSLGG